MIDRAKNWAKSRPQDTLEYQLGLRFHNAQRRLQRLFIDDRTYLKTIFQKEVGYPLDLANPTTFNEKLQWLKLYYRKPLLNILADKMDVRGYVTKIVGDHYLNTLLGVYSSVDEIERALPTLPNKFVLKANHGSGWNVIVKDKTQFGNEERNNIREWLGKNYYHRAGREWPYKDIPPKIVCEQFIDPIQPNSNDLLDYKFFCFDGVAHYIQVDVDRFHGHHRNIYNMSWEQLPLDYEYARTDANRVVPRPSRLDEMIDVAEQLSVGLPFARIDLYAEEKITFGEVTFFPESGFSRFNPIQYDYEFGQLLILPSVS